MAQTVIRLTSFRDDVPDEAAVTFLSRCGVNYQKIATNTQKLQNIKCSCVSVFWLGRGLKSILEPFNVNNLNKHKKHKNNKAINTNHLTKTKA